MFLKQIQEAEAAAGMVAHRTGVDTSPAFSMVYVPKSGTGGTAALATLVVATTLTMTVDGAAPTGLDGIGTTGVLSTEVASGTIGALVNKINTYGAWRARCLCDPAIPVKCLLAQTVTSCLLDGGLTLYLDHAVADDTNIDVATTTYLSGSVPITGDAFFTPTKNGVKWQIDHQVRNYIYAMQIRHNFTTSCTLRIKAFKKGDIASKTLLTVALADDTLTNYNVTNPAVPFIEGPEGWTLVVEARSTDDVHITNFEVLGKTVVRDGSYTITSKQY